LERQTSCIDEVIWLLEFFRERRKDFHMSEVQLSVTFNVVAQANPLTVTPATQTENLTVNVSATGTPVAVVSGGVPPYAYALDPTSGPFPPGILFAEDLAGNVTLSGTPTAPFTSTTAVLLDITDAAGASAQLKTKIAVA
jgi:hypothetical protein